MAFVENLDVFFLDFGITAVVDGGFVRGIFDNQFATTLGFTAGTGPILLCKTADIAAVEQGGPVHVGATNYTVSAIEPDGTGLTLLRLLRA